jgi:hypothetical protein
MLNDPDERLLCNLVTVFYVWIPILSVSVVWMFCYFMIMHFVCYDLD